MLRHVSAALAGTYAYVNPVVAIVAGWLLNAEEITVWIAGGMTVILSGVALVRGGTIAPRADLDKARKELREAKGPIQSRMGRVAGAESSKPR